MSRHCTRCFRELDREPDTFVEWFSDSAWCSDCLCEFELGAQQLPDPITKGAADTRPTAAAPV